MTDRSRDTAGSKMEPGTSLVAPQLSDEQWSLISDLFSAPQPDARGGRPRADARQCLEGILWILRSGARWKDLPRSFPSYVTCWRRFAEWTRLEVWSQLHTLLLSTLGKSGVINLERAVVDSASVRAVLGGATPARTRRIAARLAANAIS